MINEVAGRTFAAASMAKIPLFFVVVAIVVVIVVLFLPGEEVGGKDSHWKGLARN